MNNYKKHKKMISIVTLGFILLVNVILLGKEIKNHDKAPSIILRNLNDKIFIIDKKFFRKKPVLISFFYVNCRPCAMEIPELENLNKIYQSKVNMFLISTDKEGIDVVHPYVHKRKIKIEVLLDKYKDVARDYGIKEYPSLFLISRRGKVLYHSKGYSEKKIKMLERYLKSVSR